MLKSNIKDQCFQFVNKNNFLFDCRGFCSDKSTVTNRLCSDKYLLNEINDDHAVDVILLDFARAFDKVPHDQLLNCLASFNFSYRLMNWFKDFLCSRAQYVWVNSASSPLASVKSGVVQGSVVGLFLFTLFINSLHVCEINREFFASC